MPWLIILFFGLGKAYLAPTIPSRRGQFVPRCFIPQGQGVPCLYETYTGGMHHSTIPRGPTTPNDETVRGEGRADGPPGDRVDSGPGPPDGLVRKNFQRVTGRSPRLPK